MPVTVSRIYDTPGKAAGVVDELKRSGFSEGDLTEISAGGPDTVGAITAAGVSSTHAPVYAEAVGRGNALVICRPLFGWAAKAASIMDSHGPVAVELPAEQTAAKSAPTSTSWTGPAPLSARFGWRVLYDDPAPLSKKFGWRVLSDDPTPLSKKLGWGIGSHNPDPLSSKLGLRVLSDAPAALSSKFGWNLLSDNPAPLSSRFNLKVLSDKATPLSDWLNFAVLKKGGATTFDIKLSDSTPTVPAQTAPAVETPPPPAPPSPPRAARPRPAPPPQENPAPPE
jgi:hypothetical protein